MRPTEAVRPVPILLVEDDPQDVQNTRRASERGRVLNALHVVHDGDITKELLQNRDLLRPAAKPDGRVVDAERPQRGLWPRLRAFCASLLALRLLARPRYGHGSAIAPKPAEHSKFLQAVVTIGRYWLCVAQIPEDGGGPQA